MPSKNRSLSAVLHCSHCLRVLVSGVAAPFAFASTVVSFAEIEPEYHDQYIFSVPVGIEIQDICLQFFFL